MNTNLPEYAPTANTSFTIGTTATYYDEINKNTLIKSNLHKSVLDSLQEVYSILPTLEMIEVSYLKDYLTNKEKYLATIHRLIQQYQMISKNLAGDAQKVDLLIREYLPGLSRDMSNFLDELVVKFNINYPHAVVRLKNGLPVEATTSGNGVTDATNGNSKSRLIAEITGNFITCMDAVKLNYKSKDQLHPLLSELIVNLNDLNEDLQFNGKSKLVNWLIKINNLSTELDQKDLDLFLNDLDVAYKGFYTTLQ
ncbi:VPS28 Vacuolar protein sorting-associated protein 28 [Candida maltosa Xu316]|uniref:Vacuolar protein sorting-associated protein 28 n=1 Tax=Candida maltosa (strain Xu316) TaxID=1245528 RepID=M3HPB0_CANMX|nr:hypothetical protein G210_5939 [Candida maltosa Xu316]